MGTFRVILALLVIAVHTPGYYDLFSFRIANTAIAVFFFISGYLMPLTYESAYLPAGFGQSVKRFYLNRFLRIYPLYWVSLLMWLAGFIALNSIRTGGRVLEVDSVTILSNFALIGVLEFERFLLLPPTWTLDLEMQFYLIVPMIILLMEKRQFWRIVFGFLAIGSLILCLANDPIGVETKTKLDLILPTWFYLFYAGLVSYKYKWPEFFVQRASRGLLVALFLTSLLFFHGLLSREFILSAFLIVIAAYLLRLQKEGRTGPLDKFIGEFSYPLYILHWPVLAATHLFFAKRLGLFGEHFAYWALLSINVAACTAVAWFALKFISFPIERLRRRNRERAE